MFNNGFIFKKIGIERGNLAKKWDLQIKGPNKHMEA